MLFCCTLKVRLASRLGSANEFFSLLIPVQLISRDPSRLILRSHKLILNSIICVGVQIYAFGIPSFCSQSFCDVV